MFKKDFNFPLLILAIYISLIALFMGALLTRYLPAEQKKINDKLGQRIKHLFVINADKAEFILREGLPLLKGSKRIEPDNKFASLVKLSSRVSPYALTIKTEGSTERDLMISIGQNRKEDYKSKKEAKLKAEGSHEGEKERKIKLWQTEVSSTTDRESSDPRVIEDRATFDNLFTDINKSMVGIYHAHTAESYQNGSNNYRAAPGQRGDVVKVGQHLKKVLKREYNIISSHDTTVHDGVHSKSYIEAVSTGKRLVNKNNDLKLLFDIHRDSIPNAPEDFTTVEINGRDVAQIMIVVTSDKYGLPHPQWNKNLQLARDLGSRMERMYPGLLREIKLIENRRYNLHLHPGALLLEVGSTKNDLPEAKRAMELFADVIADFLREQRESANFDYLD